MIARAPQTRPAERAEARYTGEVVYIYAFDVAYDTARQPIGQLLGQPVAQFSMDGSKRNPRQFFFYKPQMVRLPPMERQGVSGMVRVERAIKLLPVGAISITMRLPFSVQHIEDLVMFHDLKIGNYSLHEEARRLAEQVVAELKGHFIRPQEQLPEEEAYTVFCIAAPLTGRDGLPVSAENWFQSADCQASGKRVLVADASAFSRGMIRSGLDMAGYSVSEAANLEEAVCELEKQTVDVVVVALDLPCDGSSALLATLHRRPEWEKIPVLALSNSAKPGQSAAAQQAGFQDCQAKFDREQVLESVAKLASPPASNDLETVCVGEVR